MGVQPLDQIQKIRHALVEDPKTPETTPVRHRRIFVAQVRRSGWLDEAQFALQLLGRTPAGLLGLVPLGVRMALRGKVPLRHRALTRQAEVATLIDAVLEDESQHH
jgi:succinate dehydrogenase / fumarate reductase iron-sulfur subunit